LKVTRSTMAATRRGSGKTVPHSLKGRFGGDRDRGPFFAFGDDLEQQFGSARVDLDVSELIETEQIQAVASHDAGEDPLVGGFDEFVDQLRGGDVADPAALLAGRQSQSYE
jgi:hypothetical protein